MYAVIEAHLCKNRGMRMANSKISGLLLLLSALSAVALGQLQQWPWIWRPQEGRCSP